uniref:ORF2 n=1 Tax=Rodent Torque teno virus 1 TaxID=1514664 RepID=X2G551_9VIRU|nr:ORF2 [Rodent Torque teno virus 1]AHN14908.1 ORF2 [Rodent Torque teno virus 1]
MGKVLKICLTLCLFYSMNIDEDFIYKEDQWLCMVRQTHELFCQCTSWTSHLGKLLDFNHPGWHGESQEDLLGGEEPTTENHGEPTDEELLAALEEQEDGGGPENNTRLEF